MNPIFTEASLQNMSQVANRYCISTDAVSELTYALMLSNGTMAQFNISELGGGGQWMLGGMTMVGDMFNNQLKYTVDGLCTELSNLINQGGIQYKPSPVISGQNQGSFQSNNQGNWWGDLGYPNSTGSQNGTSYAIFSQINRLAIQENGNVTVFDTLDHQIGGVGQQQGGNYSVTFTSQYGIVNLGSLPIVLGDAKGESPEIETSEDVIQNKELPQNLTQEFVQPEQVVPEFNETEGDIFNKIEKLAGLKEKDIISQEEFDIKKKELLARI